MEKIYGTTERHAQLLVFGTNRAVLIYGYGEENGQGYDYRHVFDHHPSQDEIREIIVNQIDANTDAKILTGYQWTILHGDLTKPEESRHVGGPAGGGAAAGSRRDAAACRGARRRRGAWAHLPGGRS